MKTNLSNQTKTSDFVATKGSKPKRIGETYSLRRDQIVIEEGFNGRFSLPRVEELMHSILKNGIQEDLTVTKIPGEDKYTLKNGHRRIAAYDLAVEKGFDVSLIKIPVRSKKLSDEQSVVTLITSNDGVPLTTLEEAHVFARLRNFSWTPTEISEKTGRSYTNVSNGLYLVDNLNKKLENKIKDGEVSASHVIKLLRENKDNATVVEGLINKVQESVAPTTNGVRKVRQRDMEASGVVERKVRMDEKTAHDLFRLGVNSQKNGLKGKALEEAFQDFWQNL